MSPSGPRGGDCPATVEHSFPGTRESVAQARAWLRAMLEKFGVGAEAAENAVLVLSELATNASIHSRSGGPHGTYLVRLRRGVTRLRLEVIDAGGTTEPRAQRSRQPGSRPPGSPQPGNSHWGNGALDTSPLDTGPPGNGSLSPVHLPPADLPTVDGAALPETGHGLALVEAFATRWWTRGDETGRTVTAELALNP